MSTCIVGKFESFHRGHQYLIRKAKEYGENVKLISIWLPIKTKNYQPLFTKEEREELAREFGAKLVTINFESVKNLNPDEFFSLLKRLGCTSVIAGEDWKFGKERAGNIEIAKRIGETLGIKVIPIKPVKIGDKKIGTSTIRELLKKGKIEEANSLLGFSYFCTGTAEKGRGIGRKIGFPTINIKCTKPLLIRDGVYKVKIKTSSFEEIAIANYGVRPTFKSGNRKVLEIHVPEKEIECVLCGTIRVEFLKFIRPERKFSSIEELKKQINLDIQTLKGG